MEWDTDSGEGMGKYKGCEEVMIRWVKTQAWRFTLRYSLTHQRDYLGDIYQCHLDLLVVSTLSWKNSIIPSSSLYYYYYSNLKSPHLLQYIHPSIYLSHSNVRPSLAWSDRARGWVKGWEMEGRGDAVRDGDGGMMQGHTARAPA